ncbi:hypothetical protein TrLO_g15294 [Triparma laevis f. longispina]|uniref:Uncharacterized protein n=1 Tax=Triparma laevis f. longispina TaxID=1714387 RepID=A0A9W7KSE5_9STRA|nr:hypothetical protein TrLO_g15294 [Triparma laevis f. longispina]
MEDVLSRTIIHSYPCPAPPVPPSPAPLSPLLLQYQTFLNEYTHSPSTQTQNLINRCIGGWLNVIFGKTVNEYKTQQVPNEIRPCVPYGLITSTATYVDPKKSTSQNKLNQGLGLSSLTSSVITSLPPPPPNPTTFTLQLLSPSSPSLLTLSFKLPNVYHTLSCNNFDSFMCAISRGTLGFILRPEEVLKSVKPIANGQNAGLNYNPNYFLPNSTLTLYAYQTISPTFNPLHPGSFKNPSVFTSYQTGQNGFDKLINDKDMTKCKIKLTQWEDVIVRILNASCSGVVRRRVDVQSNNNQLLDVPGEPSKCLKKVLETLCSYYLPKKESEAWFLSLIITEYVGSQYNLRPSSEIGYEDFQKKRTGSSGPVYVPPPVRIRDNGSEDRGYNSTLYPLRLLFGYEDYEVVYQQSLYACLVYVVSGLDFGVYEVGSGGGFRGCKIWEWGMWCRCWCEFIEVAILGLPPPLAPGASASSSLLTTVSSSIKSQKISGFSPQKIREKVLSNYHLLNDVFNVLVQRVSSVDPGREDIITCVEQCLKTFLKIKNVVTEVSVIVDKFLSGQDCGQDSTLYLEHCKNLNGYRPYYNHALERVDVVDAFSELCNAGGRFSLWKGRIEGMLNEGWGEGIRSKEVVKGVKGKVDRDADGLLTSSGLNQIMTLGKCDASTIPFIGDPLLLPCRENEIEILVDLTVYLSQLLNKHFGLVKEQEVVDRDEERRGEKREGEWKERAKAYRQSGFRFDFRGLSDWRNLMVMFVSIWVAKKIVF